MKVVFRSLQASPVTFRVLQPSLRLGAIAVWLLNSLIFRPGEQRWDEAIVETSVAYETGGGIRGLAVLEEGEVVEVDDGVELDDEAEGVIAERDAIELIHSGDAIPMTGTRGCYFLAAIGLEFGYLTCGAAKEVAPQTYAMIYNQPTFQALELTILEAHAKAVRKTNQTKSRNRQRPVTDIQENMNDRDKEFNLAAAGIRIPITRLLTGVEIIQGAAAGGTLEERFPGGILDADREVNLIWRQFLRDLLAFVPRMKDGTGSYCLLTTDQISAATEEIYQGTVLPFRCAAIKVASQANWNELFFNRFFPPKSV